MNRNGTPPRMSSRDRAIAMAAALCLALPIAARAEVRVEGNSAAIRITTSQEDPATVFKQLADDLNREAQPVIRQVKALTG